jgi:hypothetical protein
MADVVPLWSRVIHQFGGINSARVPLGNGAMGTVKSLSHIGLKAVKSSFLEVANAVKDQVLPASLEKHIKPLAMVHKRDFVRFVVPNAVLVVDNDRGAERIADERVSQ